jgi:putative oxidoreductase
MSATSPNLRHPGDTDDVLGKARAHAVDHGHSLLQRIIQTDATLHAAVARLTLGLVMLPHSLQKILGWFGGQGFSGTYQAFTTHIGLPGVLAFLAIIGEFFGALALIVGVLTRAGAAAIIIVMLGAIATVHAPNGFFMNWMGQKAGEGFEYHLLAIGLGLVCLLAGGGRVSVDHAIMNRRPAEGGSVSPALSEG